MQLRKLTEKAACRRNCVIETTWTGDLGRMALPEVMSELHREHATGVLFCLRGGLAREVSWERGAPLWARSSHPDDALGKWLFRRCRLGLEAVGSGAEDARGWPFLCLWCTLHCACLVPQLVEDEELADEPVVVSGS